MSIYRIAAVTLLVSAATAFRNTSPFFLYSTSPFPSTSEPVQITSSSSLSSDLSTVLRRCDSDAYIIISQPSVSASDFETRRAAPNLQAWLNSTYSPGNNQASIVVPEVVGRLDIGAIIEEIEQTCKATVVEIDASTGTIPNGAEVKPRIINVEFPSLTTLDAEERVQTLADRDAFLHAVVSSQGGDAYTVLYITTPPSFHYVPKPPTYEMENNKYESVLHTDLKRDVQGSKSSNDTSNAPLFEKYSFFSPGIFIGLVVSTILFSILYVGINAVSSLQVSYFAFSKEMGPTQQKKQ